MFDRDPIPSEPEYIEKANACQGNVLPKGLYSPLHPWENVPLSSDPDPAYSEEAPTNMPNL